VAGRDTPAAGTLPPRDADDADDADSAFQDDLAVQLTDSGGP